jgi:hypothetical protein
MKLTIPEKSSCVPITNDKGEVVSLTKRMYTVQIASFNNLEAAKAKLLSISKLGINGIIRKTSINNQNWYRVQVGEHIGYSSAKTNLDKLVEKSQSGIIMSVLVTNKVEKLIVKTKIVTGKTPDRILTVISDVQDVGVRTITDLKTGAKKRFEKLTNQ